MMKKLLYNIAAEISRRALNVTGTFVIAFFIGWGLNGSMETHFDLGALLTAYGVISGVNVTKHTVNSIYNSPKGEAPGGVK